MQRNIQIFKELSAYHTLNGGYVVTDTNRLPLEPLSDVSTDDSGSWSDENLNDTSVTSTERLVHRSPH